MSQNDTELGVETYDAFVTRMEKTYPDMFSQQYGGIAVGDGWWHIIETLCKNIDSHITWTAEMSMKDPVKFPVCPPVVIEQIKEKFGSLRFYYQGGDDTVDGMVRMAEAWADSSCEVCGARGVRRSGGWIQTLCDEHERERQERKRNA